MSFIHEVCKHTVIEDPLIAVRKLILCSVNYPAMHTPVTESENRTLPLQQTSGADKPVIVSTNTKGHQSTRHAAVKMFTAKYSLSISVEEYKEPISNHLVVKMLGCSLNDSGGPNPVTAAWPARIIDLAVWDRRSWSGKLARLGRKSGSSPNCSAVPFRLSSCPPTRRPSATGGGAYEDPEGPRPASSASARRMKMGSTILCGLLLIGAVACVSADFLMGGHLDNKHVKVSDDTEAAASSHLVLARTAEDGDLDLIAEESGSSVASTAYPDQEPRYKVPYAFAFNGGKPFSLEKDPITGKIDFEKTPPVKALNLSETYHEEEPETEDSAKLSEDYPYGKVSYLDSKRVVSTNSKNERVGPNEINPYSPSFHDFLNLPVRYTSDKYDRENYPLISSSYANTKVQSGSNSYNINNHRPYHQETATKTSISTATRKVYYSKPTTTSTTTSTTTTTTPRPETTTTTTMRPTTSKPVEKKTTTVSPTKPPTTTTMTPSTTRTVPTTTTTTPRAPVTQPKITTWKPNKSTTRYDEYEEMLPIEKLQGTKHGTQVSYGQYPMMDKELNGHNNGPQSPYRGTTQTTYDYNDGYEDYEASPEEHSRPMHDHREVVHRVELTSPSSTTTTTTISPTTTTASVPSTTMPPTTSTATPTTPTEHPMLSIHLTTAKPTMLPVHQQQPVTSMPLDSGTNTGHIHIPPVHENFVEGHRPIEFHGGNNNGHPSVLFPGNANNGYGRPGSVINVLPESTSNVIVPHDQDTVSFVLGNRQNVEGSYYTHGTAMEEHPYAPNSNENNFRPIFNAGSGGQQLGLDQQVSVGMSSVSVVDPSNPSNYNPPKWYNPVPSGNEGPVKTTVMNENEPQKGNPQAPVVFPVDNDKKDASTQTENPSPQSSFVSFPDSIKDRNDAAAGQNQRPVEEHIIVINQADGSIKEITPTGATNIENTLVLGGNGNGNINNNPNLPQLSENLTPPAESRPLRPPLGGNNQRPPYYFHYQHGNGPQGKPGQDYPPRPQRIPLPPRQKPDSPPIGFKRRPSAPHDQKLPNILPQFRPNAKTSHGHRGPDKIGTLPAPQSYPNNRQRPTVSQSQPPHLHPSRRPQPHHPISPPPSHLQRLSPPPPPPPQQSHPHQQNPVLRKKEDGPGLPTPEYLKRYRPPVSASSGRPPIAQKLRMEDEIASDRFSAEPPQIPPRPIIFPNNRADSQMPKVATLQMIQQRGGLDEEIIRSNLPPVFKVNRSDEKEEETSDNNEESDSEADLHKDNDGDGQDAAGAEAGPVYVVYPVNSAVNIGSQEDTVERDESVVIGTRGPHRPLPPDTLPQDEDDKAPGYFYGKKPHHNTINSDFGSQGYPLDLPEHSVLVREKPLLVPSDGVDDEEALPLPPKKLIEESIINSNPSNPNSSENTNSDSSSSSDSSFNVISYLQDFLPFGSKKQQPQTATISATLPRLPIVRASSPIAYVYTPTTPSALHRHNLHFDEDEDEEERPILPGRRDEKPVLLPSQQPSSSSSSAPSPQNFMAPFIASVSAEMPVKNGWSVVAPPLAQVNGTERTKDDKAPAKEEADKQTGSVISQENESQTEKSDESFDAENFKPQLFGGFKPIYEFPVDDEDRTPMGGRAVSRSQEQNVNVNAETGRKLE